MGSTSPSTSMSPDSRRPWTEHPGPGLCALARPVSITLGQLPGAARTPWQSPEQRAEKPRLFTPLQHPSLLLASGAPLSLENLAFYPHYPQETPLLSQRFFRPATSLRLRFPPPRPPPRTISAGSPAPVPVPRPYKTGTHRSKSPATAVVSGEGEPGPTDWLACAYLC